MPRYETISDLKNEQSVIEHLSETRDYTFRKLPTRYVLDYAVIKNGDVIGFAEIKCRTCASTDYDTMMVSLSKVLAAHQLSQVTGLPSYLIVRWTDKIGSINFKADHAIRAGGRTDRGDAQDIDVCAYYPITVFTQVNTSC